MIQVLLRALQAHNIEPPPPGPSCKEQTIRLLLVATKKRRLRDGESDGSGELAEDDGTVDVDNTDDAASEISLTS
eukprot:5775418-Pleurochrysis_carterae.AAC.1